MHLPRLTVTQALKWSEIFIDFDRQGKISYNINPQTSIAPINAKAKQNCSTSVEKHKSKKKDEMNTKTRIRDRQQHKSSLKENFFCPIIVLILLIEFYL